MARVFQSLSLAALLMCSWSAHAALISLDAITTGSVARSVSYSSNGAFPATYYRQNPLTSLGYYLSRGTNFASESNGVGFAVFDLSPVSFVADSAVLELAMQYADTANHNVGLQNHTLNIQLLDSALAPDFAATPDGGQAAGWTIVGAPDFIELDPGYSEMARQYDAISGALSGGAVAISDTVNRLFSVDLNSAALAQINADGGLLALGLTWDATASADFNSLSASDVLNFTGAPRLYLTGAAVEVSAPSVSLLIASAWLLLLRTKPARRSQ